MHTRRVEEVRLKIEGDGVNGTVFNLARPYLDTRDNEVHTIISYGYAHSLLAQGGDPEVVLPAILLHDIGWSFVPSEKHLTAIGPNATDPDLRFIHEREGARVAADLLRSLSFPEERIGRICEIIDGHDTREGCLGVDDALVMDADKLFRFSEAGFAITVNWYGMDPETHLNWIIKAIPTWMLTKEGARLARWEAEKRSEEIRAGRFSS